MKLTYLDYDMDDLQPQIMDKLVFLKLQKFGWSQKPRSRYVALTMYETKADSISIMDYEPDQELVLILSVQYINSENMQPLGCLFYGREVGVEKIAEALVKYIKDLVKCECFVMATLSNISDKITKVIEYMMTKSGYDRKDEYSEMVYSVANMEIVHLFDPISLIENMRDLFWCHNVHFRMSKREVVGKYSDFIDLLKHRDTPADYKKIYINNEPSTATYAVRIFSQLTFHALLDYALRNNIDNSGTPELVHLFDIAFDSLAGDLNSAKANRGPISSSSPHLINWRRFDRTIRTMYLTKNNTRFDICHRILASKFKTDHQKVTSTIHSLIRCFKDYDNLYDLPPNFVVENFSMEDQVHKMEQRDQQHDQMLDEDIEEIDEKIELTINKLINDLDNMSIENGELILSKIKSEKDNTPSQSESSDDEDIIKHIALHNDLAFVPTALKDCRQTLNEFSQVEKTEWNPETITGVLTSIGKARKNVEQSLAFTHFDKPVHYSPDDFEHSKSKKLTPKKEGSYQRSNLKCDKPNLKDDKTNSKTLKNNVYKSKIDDERNLKDEATNLTSQELVTTRGSDAKIRDSKPKKEFSNPKISNSNSKCKKPNLKDKTTYLTQQECVVIPSFDDAKTNDLEKSKIDNERNLKDKATNLTSQELVTTRGSDAKITDSKLKKEFSNPKISNSNSKCKKPNLKDKTTYLTQQECVVIPSFDDAKTNDLDLEKDDHNQKSQDIIFDNRLKTDVQSENVSNKTNLKRKKRKPNQKTNFQPNDDKFNLKTGQPNLKNNKSAENSRHTKSVGRRDNRKTYNLESGTLDKSNLRIKPCEDIESVVDLYNDVVDSKFNIDVNHLDKNTLTNLSDYVNLSNQLKERYPGQVDELGNGQLFSHFMSQVVNDDTIRSNFEELKVSSLSEGDENITNKNRDGSNEAECTDKEGIGENNSVSKDAIEIDIYYGDHNCEHKIGEKNENVPKKFAFFYRMNSSDTWKYTTSILDIQSAIRKDSNISEINFNRVFDVDSHNNGIGEQTYPSKFRMPLMHINLQNNIIQPEIMGIKQSKILAIPKISRNDQEIRKAITHDGKNKEIENNENCDQISQKLITDNNQQNLKGSTQNTKNQEISKSKKRRNKKKKRQSQQSNNTDNKSIEDNIEKKVEINKNDTNNPSIGHVKKSNIENVVVDKSTKSKAYQSIPTTSPVHRNPSVAHGGLASITAMAVNLTVNPIKWVRCLRNIMDLLRGYDTSEVSLHVTAGYLKQSGLVEKFFGIATDTKNVFEIISSCTTTICSRIISHPASTSAMKKNSLEYLATIDRFLDTAQRKLDKSNVEEMEVDETSSEENLDKSIFVNLQDVVRDITDIPEGKLLANLDEKFVPFSIIAWSVSCNGMRRLSENLRKNRAELISNACLNLNGTRHCVAVIQQYYNIIDEIPDSRMRSEFLFADLITGAFLGNGCVLLK